MPSYVPTQSAGRARKTREILYDNNDDEPTTVEDDAANNNNEEEENNNNILPSGRQIASDLIDATCHAILHLGSQKENKDDDDCIIPPFTSYFTLMQRLEYYIDDYHRESSSSGLRPLDKNSIVHHRLLMTRVIIDICSRKTYPCLPPHTDSSGLDTRLALIDVPASFWQDQCAKLREIRYGPDITDDNNGQYDAIDCQMVALEALAELRAELYRAEAINTEGGNVVAQKIVDDATNVYVTKTSAIDKRLKKARLTHYADLFVPENTLFFVNGEEEEADDDSSPTDGIEGMIQHRVFPIRNLQIEILRLLQGWESEYLTPPALYANGYFKHDDGALPSKKSSVTLPSKKALVALPSKKASVALPSKRSRAPSPPRKARTTTTLKFDSDDEVSDYSPAAPRSKKKMKGKGKVRVPYSDKEKKMLMDGVEAFGVGQWAKILEHYDFTENNRTSVNLKDLHRTLMKKASGGAAVYVGELG
jgi:hypothetical protein